MYNLRAFKTVEYYHPTALLDTLFLQKYHNFLCNRQVICIRCSAHQINLPYLDDNPNRVCDKCFVPLPKKLERRQSEAVLTS